MSAMIKIRRLRWLMPALLLMAGVCHAQGDEPTGKPTARSFPAMDQATRDWLNAPESAAFGKWLTEVLKQYPDHPEWLTMYADILQGSRLGATDGWFTRAVAQSRYGWKSVSERFDIDGDGKISTQEFPGSTVDFVALDRNGDAFLTEEDFDWSEHALAQTPGFMLYMEADADSDGRVTKEEFDAIFARIDRGGLGFVSADELRALLNPPPPARGGGGGGAARRSGPDKATLVRGLFQQEIGAMKPGPGLGEPAPDFTLRTANGQQAYTLSELIGDRPVVLVFGNITCGPFRGQAGNVQKVYERYKDRAHFLMVYVREAHPTDGWHMTFNDRYDVKLPQPVTYDDRVSVAQTCQQKLGFDMPFLVDTIDDSVGGVYSGMPSRLYVIDRAGKVAYKSGRGPFGFKPAEMEQSLIWTLTDGATQNSAGIGAGGGAAATPTGEAPGCDDAKPEQPQQDSAAAADQAARVPLLESDAAWARLPVEREEGGTAPALPVWARALARSLPRATAAMLALDHRHRAESPLDPVLRAQVRWVVADTNRCDYAKAQAESDLVRAGVASDRILALKSSQRGDESERVRRVLDFAHDLTRDGSQVADRQVEELVADLGPDKVVALVQLIAFSNFQDRLLLALGIRSEPGGVMAPLAVKLDPRVEPERVARVEPQGVGGPPGPERVDDPLWAELNVDAVRAQLKGQQGRASRIRVPSFEEVVKGLPPGVNPPPRPIQIQWSLVCMGYQPLLATGWSACTRGFAQDAQQDRVFEESLFWVVTRTIHCFY